MQPHFVCSECGFSSKLLRTCQNESCVRQGERLSDCVCEDGRHSLILKGSVGNSENDAEDENLEDEEGRTDRKDSSTKTIDLDDPNLE